MEYWRLQSTHTLLTRTLISFLSGDASVFASLHGLVVSWTLMQAPLQALKHGRRRMASVLPACNARAVRVLPAPGCACKKVSRVLSTLSHVDSSGRPSMVDVGEKPVTRRTAMARCRVLLPLHSMTTVMRLEGANELISKKGPVFATAIVAGVMGAKKTSELIPFCHPLPLDDCKVEIGFDPERANEVVVECTVKVHHKTGVEMEALSGASMAALCIYDMCKATSHDIIIKDLQVLSKTGGKRGDISRAEVVTQVPGASSSKEKGSSKEWKGSSRQGTRTMSSHSTGDNYVLDYSL